MKDDTEGTIPLENTSSLFQIGRKLKNSIFDVLFILLDNSSDDEESLFGLAFQTGADYLQMMAFPFDGAVIAVWNAGDTLDNITGVIGSFNVSTYMPGIEFSTFLILLYSLIFMIILVILDIIYVAYSFSKKKFEFTWPLVLLAKIVPLFVTVLFLPIMETLLQVVNCSSDEAKVPDQQVMVTFPDIVCWEGWHLFHSVITLLFSSFFVFISCIVTLALFEPRMTSNRLTARQNSTGQVVFIINKIICQFFFSFSPFTSSLPYTLILFVLSGWLYSTYNISKPYYDTKASKFFRILSTYYFWTNLMLLVSEVLRPLNFKGGLVVWISGLLCIGLGIIFQRKSNIDTLFSSSLKFKSGEELESHLQYVLQLLHNKNEDKNCYMLLLGYIEKHIELCTQDDCPLRVINPKITSGKQQEEYSCKQLLKQLERMFKHGIKKYPECTKLRLTFAFFYMQKMNNTKKAYQQFTKAIQTDPSFGEQFIIYRFRKIIRQNLQAKAENGDKTDLIQMIRFDNYVSLCEEAMLISARLHKEFWIELEEQSPNLDKLNKIGSQITQTLTIIKQNYDEVMKLESSSPELQYNYAFYMIFIMQEIQLGKTLLYDAKLVYEEKFRDLNSQIKDEDEKTFNLSATNSALLVVNAEDKKSFKIQKVNNKFLQLVKYTQDQLKYRDLNRVMPGLLKTGSHDEIMKKWLESGHQEGKYVGNQQSGFIKDKAGFIKRVSYTVKYQFEQCRFIVHFVHIPEPKHQFTLMVDRLGYVVDYTYYAYLLIKEQLKYDLFTIFELDINDLKIPPCGESEEGQNVRLREQIFDCFARRITKRSNSDDSNDFNLIKMQKDEDSFEVREELGFALRFYESGYNQLKSRSTGFRKTKNQSASEKFYKFKKIILKQYEVVHETLSDKFKESMVQSVREDLIDYAVYENEEGEEKMIKTYRYVKGHLKRLYFDNLLDTESDYDYEQMNTDLEAQINREKLGQYHYQDKIKNSLKTNIQHPELTKLLCCSVIMFLLFLAAIIGNYVFLLNEISQRQLILKKMNNNTLDSFFILQELTLPLFNDVSNATQYDEKIKQMENYQITYEILPSLTTTAEPTQQLNEYILTKNTTKYNEVSIKHGLIMIQASIITYYSKLLTNNQTTISEELSISYQNFVRTVYPVLDNLSLLITPDYFTYYLLFIGAVVLIWLLFGIFWIYTILAIKQKVFGVLIWFLDIPLDYVKFLRQKCLYFIKHYSGVKEIVEKQIKIHDQVHYVDQYNGLLGETSEDGKSDDQFMGGNNNRKILVTRYRKQDLLSKFTCKHLLIFLSVIFGGFYASFIFTYKSISLQEIDFLSQNYQVQSRMLLWLQTMPLALKLQEESKENGVLDASDKNLTQSLQMEVKSNFLNTFTKYNLTSLIDELASKNNMISENFVNIYYGNLCEQISSQEDCEKLVKSTMIGGITSYTQYLGHFLFPKNQQKLNDLYTSQKQYASVEVMKMLNSWFESMETQLSAINSILEITLYIYIFLYLVVFCVVWIYYIRSTNTKLNRTIQMLNMIPMVLLPEIRKEMRDFLHWIMLQAVKEEQQ